MHYIFIGQCGFRGDNSRVDEPQKKKLIDILACSLFYMRAYMCVSMHINMQYILTHIDTFI